MPSPIDGPKATARPMIANTCSVIGTDQNGTCAFAETAIRRRACERREDDANTAGFD